MKVTKLTRQALDRRRRYKARLQAYAAATGNSTELPSMRGIPFDSPQRFGVMLQHMALEADLKKWEENNQRQAHEQTQAQANSQGAQGR